MDNRRGRGAMTVVSTTVSIGGDPWEVQYARFFVSPQHPSNFKSKSRSKSISNPDGSRLHPSLVPLNKRPKGTWISTFTSLASLQLLTTSPYSSYRCILLTVTLNNNVLEEHYISKLNFTWPQVSCMTGNPPRGSKVVFMTYKDQLGQDQKFAVRFLTTGEAERFINVLKDTFGHERIIGSTSGTCKSKTSSESEFIPSFESEIRPPENWDLVTTSSELYEPMYRPIEDYIPVEASVDTYIQPLYLTENYDASLNPNHLSQDVQEKLSAFPPSFTSLLTNCFSVSELALQPTDPEDAILKKDIMKYLEDSSFQEMLTKVQKVVNELEHDFLV